MRFLLCPFLYIYAHIEKNKDYLFAPKLLQLLMECDKMRTNNVSFYNCLNYIVLSFN